MNILNTEVNKMEQTAYLSLGSNIGDRLAYLTQATKRLNQHSAITVKKISSIYETAAWGLENQADFYNAVVEITTTLSPHDLLVACQKIELELDRTREIHWGPRTIDIDILLYQNIKITSDVLTIPHQYLLERSFVTTPLLEIAPDIVINNVKVATVANADSCVKLDLANIAIFSV